MPTSTGVRFWGDWNRFHPDCTPIGYRLKSQAESRWLRFHSLPESKRYPETPTEEAILLDRQTRIAQEVLGENTPCWMVLESWHDLFRKPVLPFRNYHYYLLQHRTRRRFGFKGVGVVDVPEDDCHFRVYATPRKWHAHAFDDLLLEIADDKLDMFWVSRVTGAIFAPYDGGVDLILPDPAQKEELRQTYAEWLSPWDHGL